MKKHSFLLAVAFIFSITNCSVYTKDTVQTKITHEQATKAYDLTNAILFTTAIDKIIFNGETIPDSNKVYKYTEHISSILESTLEKPSNIKDLASILASIDGIHLQNKRSFGGENDRQLLLNLSIMILTIGFKKLGKKIISRNVFNKNNRRIARAIMSTCSELTATSIALGIFIKAVTEMSNDQTLEMLKTNFKEQIGRSLAKNSFYELAGALISQYIEEDPALRPATR